MKYYITNHHDLSEKKDLYKLGLYCYDLRDSDFGNDIATIEKSVLVNRVGSIITDKEIHFDKSNFVDYNLFIKENISVDSIDDLLVSKIYLTTIKLDNDKNIIKEFDFLFSDTQNYNVIDKMKINEKKEYILNYYSNSNDYDLMNINDKNYKLYRIDYTKKLEIKNNNIHRLLDNNIFVENIGYRNKQPVALVEKTMGKIKEYIIAFDYNIKDNKMDWSYGYYYGNNIHKAKQDFNHVLNGGNLFNTFKNTKKELER